MDGAGDCVGEAEGAALGASVGANDGDDDGCWDGEEEGETNDSKEGISEGTCDGKLDTDTPFGALVGKEKSLSLPSGSDATIESLSPLSSFLPETMTDTTTVKTARSKMQNRLPVISLRLMGHLPSILSSTGMPCSTSGDTLLILMVALPSLLAAVEAVLGVTGKTSWKNDFLDALLLVLL